MFPRLDIDLGLERGRAPWPLQNVHLDGGTDMLLGHEAVRKLATGERRVAIGGGLGRGTSAKMRLSLG